jgi:hypothetical protein
LFGLDQPQPRVGFGGRGQSLELGRVLLGERLGPELVQAETLPGLEVEAEAILQGVDAFLNLHLQPDQRIGLHAAAVVVDE